MKKIKSCVYYCAEEQIKWKIEYYEDKALITKTIMKAKLFSLCVQKREFEKEAMSNLDIFFDECCLKKWNKLPFNESIDKEFKDTIVIVCDNQTFQLSSTKILQKDEKNLFKDLNKYFNMYWEQKIKPIVLSYHSFDGGGPDFNMETERKGIFTWYSLRTYFKENHEKLCGAGYTMTYTLYPLRIGESTAILTAFSPICQLPTRKIFIKIDKNFNMTYHIEEIDTFNKR